MLDEVIVLISILIMNQDTPVKWFSEISQGRQIHTPVRFTEPTPVPSPGATGQAGQADEHRLLSFIIKNLPLNLWFWAKI